MLDQFAPCNVSVPELQVGQVYTMQSPFGFTGTIHVLDVTKGQEGSLVGALLGVEVR
ncbi:MAG: hypothetical protein HYU66_10210 [Armatimonadetes bacterium]|nr:hypothetical protein [Armatimonadota bacterium]